MADLMERIFEAVQKGDQHLTADLAKQGLKDQIPAMQILNKGLIPGLQSLSKLFIDGEVFLPEILISVRAMNHGLEVLKPQLATSEIFNKGTIVIGTVQGDVHDLGKNIVSMLFKANGYNVIDVGVDVNDTSFIDAVRDENADILAMSGLLTSTIPYFSVVIKALEEAGLRNGVKVIVGGAPVTREYADEIGAEGYAREAVSAVDEVNRLMAL